MDKITELVESLNKIFTVWLFDKSNIALKDKLKDATEKLLSELKLK